MKSNAVSNKDLSIDRYTHRRQATVETIDDKVPGHREASLVHNELIDYNSMLSWSYRVGCYYHGHVL